MKTLYIELVRELWGSGKSIKMGNKFYRMGRMSYGDYFLEPITWKGGERDGFPKDTHWLKLREDNPYIYEIDQLYEN